MSREPGASWTDEPLDQRNVVELLREELSKESLVGARVIDATAGNGHDTEFLARAVGPGGEVLAIDVQAAAVAATRARLAEHPELAARTQLVKSDHARLAALVPADWQRDVALIMFNLGYLPGGGRDFTTQPGSSVEAAAAAVELLCYGGLLCMAIYTGHPAGAGEAAALRHWAEQLEDPTLQIRLIRDTGEGTEGRPEVLLVRRGR